MKRLLPIMLLTLSGCGGSQELHSSKPFEYPPPPEAPQLMNITWAQMQKVFQSGEVTYAHESRSLQVDVYTADGRHYRTREPSFSAIRIPLKKYEPNLRPSDIQSE